MVIWWLAFRCGFPNLPPGPKGLPLLGNVHQLPTTFLERALFQWGKEYGDLVYLKLFRTPTVVLGSIEAARDLLEKRGSDYSDRPRMVMFAEMIGHGSSLPTISYGARFRRLRKWMHDAVGNRDALRSYQHIQQREVLRLVRNLAEDPSRFFDHIHLYVAAILLEVAYGRRVTSLHDELVQVAERGINASNASGSPGSRIVDFFPIFKFVPGWFPGAGFKRRALTGRAYVQAWKDTGYQQVISQMASNTASSSVATKILSEFGGNIPVEDEDDVKSFLAINLYGAGVETSRGTLVMFVLHMARNPRVLRKAQDEMEKIVGSSSKLPDFGDRERLPYLNAILEEVYRWNPSTPTAIPHQNKTDDQYRGYDIPAGSMIIANTWGITRDARYYPDAEEFRPERYLDSETSGNATLLPSSFVFGYGRSRVCPGQAFADATLWLAAAHIIALLDIKGALNKAGREVSPPAAFISGFTK
ncbi:cytochrome P450 [Trametes meyenii]|nr:cytochrome P450 [Trametes meyenii]